MSILDKLKQRLVKTRENVFGRIAGILQSSAKIDETTLEKIEEILITADLGVATTQKIIQSLQQRVKKEKLEKPELLFLMLEEEMERLIVPIEGIHVEKKLDHAKPFVILIVGVNGTGKTTTIGKLAHRYTQHGKKILLAAGDTFRAAAGGQLEIWAQRSSVEIVRQKEGADPAALIFDALASAKAKQSDIVLIDTAGRLHTKVNLMEELKKIHRVIQKQIPEAPHETLLVLDGTTGQNAIQQAKQFSQAVNVTGLVLTKLDGTAKGGVVLAIQQELKIPVYYIGIGEGIDDLEEFHAHDFVQAIVE
ncbi:signal recognition particle-docking protein FtsY [bacterium]|nr:signal recognition particle-docking protein FtsY [bacterium]